MIEWLKDKIDIFKRKLWLRSLVKISKRDFVMEDMDYYNLKYLGVKVMTNTLNIVDEIHHIEFLIENLNNSEYIKTLNNTSRPNLLPQWLSSGDMCIKGITPLVRKLYINIRILEREMNDLDIYAPKVMSTKRILNPYINHIKSTLSLLTKFPI